jgi:hypothetical protein
MPVDWDKFKGQLPYASVVYGVYQPLIGWTGAQGTKRVDRERRVAAAELVRSMMGDGRFRKAFAQLNKPARLEPTTELQPRLPEWLSGPIGEKIIAAITAARARNGGQPLSKTQMTQAISGKVLTDALRALEAPNGGTPIPGLGVAVFDPKDISAAERERLGAKLVAKAGVVVAPIAATEEALVGPTPAEAIAVGVVSHLKRHAPNALAALIASPAPWEVARDFVDPISDFDPASSAVVLSPVGLVDLFREYFYEGPPVLGPAVAHVWVSPGGSVELYEVHTRRELVQREVERLTDITTKSETTTMTQDELSDAVRTEQGEDMKLGITASGGANWGVYKAQASASFNYATTLRQAAEEAHKQLRSQTERVSSEIRRSLKTVFRSSLETEDTNTRRYVLENKTERLVNYQLRRKMRQVGVQVQHIGTRLCWQLYLDEPGANLGVAELVHIAKPDDLDPSLQPPDAPQKLASKETRFSVDFPFEVAAGDRDTDERYRNGDDDEGDHIVWQREYDASPPAAGYTIASVLEQAIVRVDPDNDPPDVTAQYDPVQVNGQASTRFRISLPDVNFNDQTVIRFNLKIIWNPPDQSDEWKTYKQHLDEYTEAKRRAAHAAYVQEVRERVKLASQITPRPSADLRAEERTVILQRVVALLTAAAPHQNRHVLSELLQAMFDVDATLYYVAPDWWTPRRHSRQQPILAPAGPRAPTRRGGAALLRRLDEGDSLPDSGAGAGSDGRDPRRDPRGGSVGPTNGPPQPQPAPLTPDDLVGWGGIGESGRDNYLITEDSDPARLGASVGWLLQLDGDMHRNAFLNSPWAKVVVPIRPGREPEALRWLQLAHVEESEGLDENYPGQEPGLQGLTIQAALLALAKEVASLDTIQNSRLTEKVFEDGFDPLAGGFSVPSRPFEIFDQFIAVLDTDQLVAQEYVPP